jgi:hypothetical protein
MFAMRGEKSSLKVVARIVRKIALGPRLCRSGDSPFARSRALRLISQAPSTFIIRSCLA